MNDQSIIPQIMAKYRDIRNGVDPDYSDNWGGGNGDVFRIGIDKDTGKVVSMYAAADSARYDWFQCMVKFGYNDTEREVLESVIRGLEIESSLENQ